MFANLTGKDICQLIAFLRTVPAVENKLPKTSFSFKGRSRFTYYSEEEVKAIYAFLVQLKN
jgi:hypothetical protein